MFSLPNYTNTEQLSRELFAVRSLVRVTFMLLTMFAALQSGAIWRMKIKEPHCGLFGGKVT